MVDKFNSYEICLKNGKRVKIRIRESLLNEDTIGLIRKGEMLYIDHNSCANVIKSVELLENEALINCTIVDVQDRFIGKASRIFNYCYGYDKNTVVVKFDKYLNVKINCTDEKKIKKHLEPLNLYKDIGTDLLVSPKQMKRVNDKACCECALIGNSLISRERENYREKLTEILGKADSITFSGLIDLLTCTGLTEEDVNYLLNIIKQKASLGLIDYSNIREFDEQKVRGTLETLNVLFSRITDKDAKKALSLYYKVILQSYLYIINKEREGISSLDFYIKVVENLDRYDVYKLQAIFLDKSFAVFEHDSIKNVNRDMAKLEKALKNLENVEGEYELQLKHLGCRYLSVLKSIKDGSFNSVQQFLKSLILSKSKGCGCDSKGLLEWAEEIDLSDIDITDMNTEVLKLAKERLNTFIVIFGQDKSSNLAQLADILQREFVERFLQPYIHENTLDTLEDIIDNCEKFNDDELDDVARYFEDYEDYNLEGMSDLEIKNRVKSLVKKISKLPTKVKSHHSEFSTIMREAVLNSLQPLVTRDYNERIKELLGMTEEEMNQPITKNFVNKNRKLLLNLLEKNKYGITDSSNLADLCGEVSNELSESIKKHDDMEGAILLSKLLVSLTDLMNKRISYSFGRAKNGRPVIIGAFK